MRTLYALTILLIVATALNRTYADKCIKAATFNAALMQMVPEYENRKERLADGLRGVDADFMCLNGIWLESDMQALVDQVSEGRGRFRHHWSPIHERANRLRSNKNEGNRTEASCSEDEMKFMYHHVLDCAMTSGCASIPNPLEAAECVAMMCRDRFQSDAIDAECIECLVLFMTPHTYHDTHFEACMDARKTKHNRYNRLNPSGLMIISKSPIKYTRYVPFFEDKDLVVERGFVEAEIDGFKVVCTHLSTNLPVYPEYDMTEYTSYEQQHMHEIDILLDRITFKCHDHLILGDLNTGPSQWNRHSHSRNLTGQWEGHFYQFLMRNYNAPFLAGHNGQCTSCRSNPLQNVTNNNVLDHVLLSTGRFYSERTKRILDDVEGGPLSDNFGQLLKVCEPDPQPLPPPPPFVPSPDGGLHPSKGGTTSRGDFGIASSGSSAGGNNWNDTA